MNQIFTPELVRTIITCVVLPILGVITKYIVTLLQIKTNELKERIKNEKCRKCIQIAEDTIMTSVAAVSQTYVETLKKEGNFCQEDKEKAFRLAKEKALSIMGDTAKEAIKELYQDPDAWIDNKIEFCVNTCVDLCDKYEIVINRNNPEKTVFNGI